MEPGRRRRTPPHIKEHLRRKRQQEVAERLLASMAGQTPHHRSPTTHPCLPPRCHSRPGSKGSVAAQLCPEERAAAYSSAVGALRHSCLRRRGQRESGGIPKLQIWLQQIWISAAAGQRAPLPPAKPPAQHLANII
jgi:hypothetical protein